MRFTAFFPVIGSVEVSGLEIDKLTNTSKDDFKPSKSKGEVRPFLERPGWLFVRRSLIFRNNLNVELKNTVKALFVSLEVW